MFGPFAIRAQAEGWDYHVLATEHDVQIADPDGIASLLSGVAERVQPGLRIETRPAEVRPATA